ncbi:MAG: hypothetical protein WBQ21_09710 [Solirubrobacteraceae bacterium]
MGSSSSRLALAVLLGCLVLLVTASGALAANITIEGNVTSAAGLHPGIGHVEVVVYNTANSDESAATAATEESTGHYSVTVAAGTYKVGFKSSFEDPVNYVAQYYNGTTGGTAQLSEATVISATTSTVGAQMQPGGMISGTVTDASTHQPLSGILVLSAVPGSLEGVETLAVTDAGGEYTLVGLPAGPSDVVFEQEDAESAVLYLPQIYDDQSLEDTDDPELLFASATPVSVSASNKTSGINAALVREEPVSTVAPVLSGTPAVGHPLSCSTGSWTGIQPLAYTYAWLRNGAPIAGATTSLYVAQAADQGAVLLCEVTATNELQVKKEPHSVSVTTASNTLTVPAAAVPPAPVMALPVVVPLAPVATLSGSKIAVSAGSVAVSIACANANCAGTIELTAQTIVKQRKGKKTTSKKETVALGKGSYSLAAGHSATFGIHLTAAGKSALAKAQHQRLSAKVRVSVTGGKTVEGTVALSEAQVVEHNHKHT